MAKGIFERWKAQSFCYILGTQIHLTKWNRIMEYADYINKEKKVMREKITRLI